jgi:DEAD/DEAH box helicase domain-containing protein
MTEVYLDIETLRWSTEVPGGWSNIPGFGLGLAVTFADGRMTCWGDWGVGGEEETWRRGIAEQLIAYLQGFDRVITFNGEAFDFKVLSGYGDVSELYKRSFDLMAMAEKHMRFKVSLDNVSNATFGRGKTGDGKQAVEWLQGRTADGFQKAAAYCIGDVMLLRDLVRYGRKYGCILWTDKKDCLRVVKIPYREPMIAGHNPYPVVAPGAELVCDEIPIRTF